MDAKQRLCLALEVAPWEQVPFLVLSRFKQAADVTKSIARIANRLQAQPGYGQVYWNPTEKTIWATLGDGDEQHVHQRWHNALKAVAGVRGVKSEAEVGPPDKENWIRVKRAEMSLLNRPFELGGKLTGGPSPLTNALVGGLLAGGVGYGAGSLLEQVLPEQFVERGRLRRSLGLVGGALGAVPGMWQASVNAENSQQAGQPLGLKSWITPNESVPLNQGALDGSKQLNDGRMHGDAIASIGQIKQSLAGLPAPDPMFLKAAAGYSLNTGATGLRPIPVDAFNNAIWNDVHLGLRSSQNNPYGTKNPWGDNSDSLHTPPAVAAAVSGLVSGVDSMYGRPSVLSPRHFIHGLAAAGVDVATARIAGGILGALGGLTPVAQQQLQTAGLWGGLIRGVTSSVLGL